jgi:hypothetical protein
VQRFAAAQPQEAALERAKLARDGPVEQVVRVCSDVALHVVGCHRRAAATWHQVNGHALAKANLCLHLQ